MLYNTIVSAYYYVNSCTVSENVKYVGCYPNNGDRGGTVVNVLCYKSEGRWFDPSWCHWNFS